MSTILKLLQEKKLLFPLIAGLVLIMAAGSTFAWLSTGSGDISNTFDAAEVTCQITETFEDGVKSDVSITNTGEMDAYIRAALIPVWKNSGTVTGTPATLSDLTIDWSDGYGTAWVLGHDGYYYCTVSVPPGASTPMLIDECTAGAGCDYHMELQIAAQAVQALPVSAVTGIWSSVTAVNEDGTLEVAP